MGKSSEVEAWLARYDNPMKAVVLRLREIILAADRRIEECIKWQAPTFTYRGNLASFFPKSKQHASLMFHTGAQIPGDHPLLEGDGDAGRVLKIASVAEAEKAKRAITKIVVAWCDWRDSAATSVKKAAPKKATAKKAAPKKATAKTVATKKATAKMTDRSRARGR